MKKITLLLLLFVSTAFYAQSTGISYQAIIYNPNGEVIPGYNNTNAPLANKNICLQFTIVDSASLTEYQEKITVTTDEYGMVNTVIGTGIQTGGYATSFANVNWSLPSKRLKVGLDTFALCTNFIEISNQLFTSVPYAFAANSAENVTGVVPILNGGTGATTVVGAKTNLGLENVDNTRDINKPISNATQAALNLKEDLANKSTNVSADGTSNTKYPSVKAIKDYVDAGINSGGTGLANEATIRANADLLKEDLVNKSTNVVTDATSNTKYPSVRAIKSYVDAADGNLTTNLNAEIAARIAGDNSLTTNLAAEITRATSLDNTLTNNVLQELTRATAAEATLTTNLATETTRAIAAENILTTNLAAEVTRATAAEATKENTANKSTVTALGTSDVLFPTQNAVKTYVDSSIATATIPDASTTAKGKLKLAGDLSGTADLPIIAANAVTSAKILDGEIVNADVSATAAIDDTKLATIATAGKVSNSATTATAINTPNTIVLRDGSGNLAAGAITATGFSGPLTGNVTGNVSGTAANVTGTVAIANGGTGSTTQNFVDITTAQTVAGAKTFSANVTAPSVTSPIYVSTPQALTSGANITWNPASGSNASVTLNQNSTLSFSTTPTAGTYGTLVVTQDATGGRTLILPSTANKVLGSSSTTTVGLSSAANAQDILNFYYDGTNCYWNIGQGYGVAATVARTSLASEVTGTLPVANGGTGSATQNFVDLTTTQTIAGNKTFSSSITASSFVKSGGTSSQFLKADGSVDTNTYLTSAPAASLIAQTTDAFGITLSSSYSGYIIYSQHAGNPFFPENLPDGFQCTIVNYSNFTFGSNTLSTARFYTAAGGNSGATTFTLAPGGTAIVNVVTINGQKRYYIKN